MILGRIEINVHCAVGTLSAYSIQNQKLLIYLMVHSSLSPYAYIQSVLAYDSSTGPRRIGHMIELQPANSTIPACYNMQAGG